MKLLVAYASKYGSTAEIAQVLGDELEKRKYEVEIKQIDEVSDLAAYDGYIIGSALYAGSWMKLAAQFLQANKDQLAQRPTWFFSSGPTGEGDPNELMGGWTFPENLAEEREAIAPKDVILFHGKIDLEKLNFAEQMMIKSVRATLGDFRNWLVIRQWARRIDLDLQAS